MTTDPVEVGELLAVRERLRADLATELTDAHRDFLRFVPILHTSGRQVSQRHSIELF